jgi:hypothetical protein
LPTHLTKEKQKNKKTSSHNNNKKRPNKTKAKSNRIKANISHPVISLRNNNLKRKEKRITQKASTAATVFGLFFFRKRMMDGLRGFFLVNYVSDMVVGGI